MPPDVASASCARREPGAGAPLANVVILVFKGVSTVESAVSSIRAQTVGNIRIVVVDDGSMDGAWQVVERLAAVDGCVILVDQPNGGIADALNAGLARCTADIVARHDADGLGNRDCFECQPGFLRDRSDCVAVPGATRPIDVAGDVVGPMLDLPLLDLAAFNEYRQREPHMMHPFLILSWTLPRMTMPSCSTCIRMLPGAAARLLAQKKVRVALCLATLRSSPLVAARLILRAGLLLGLRRVTEHSILAG